MKKRVAYVKKLALVVVFSALGVAIAPFWYMHLSTKAFPPQHMVNAILGVLAGPLWSAIAAIFIGIIRNMFNMGTIYAFPGGIPGGVVVGMVYWFLKRLKLGQKTRLLSALSEPVGTLLIGGLLSLFLFAPWIGDPNLLKMIEREGSFLSILILWSGWIPSCVPGSIMGFIILLVLNRAGMNRETLFGEK